MGRWRSAWSLVAGLLLAACASVGEPRPFAFAPAAAEELAEARRLERLRPPGWWEAAEATARAAEAAAPTWVAPRRFRDELVRARFLGHSVLAERRAALEDGADAGELYLVARLEGRDARATMERALALDRELAWAWHGLAWHHAEAGEFAAARRAAAAALARASGSHELGTFAVSRARLELDQGDTEAAREVLGAALERAELAEPERTEVSLWLALAELRAQELEVRDRGLHRAAELLRGGELSAAEYERLGDEFVAASFVHPEPEASWLAALRHDGPPGTRAARERLELRLLLQNGERALAGALARAREGGLGPGPLQRMLDFERGAGAEAVERWCAALPAVVRDADGLPRLEVLRALVLAARAPEGPEKGGRLGAALLAAGWFAEAENHAAALAFSAPEEARQLRARAAEGRALLAGLRAVVEAVDRDGRVALPGEEETRVVSSLDELLSALETYSARAPELVGGARPTDSPVSTFAGLASVVHPGPSFSAGDERAGLGRAGAVVPGLAQAFDALNRFGLFGQAPGGGGPDGTVLRRIGLEWKRGAHLGVSFEGLVAWCEGADLPSRPVRAGAAISGAALHEGYWIDVESVREDHAALEALTEELRQLPAEARVAVLRERGPRLSAADGADEAARLVAGLGEGQRVVLAVLEERGSGTITLEERLANTALHEEGHLTERSRFLPLSRRWPALLVFALRHGATPSALARALEYRAQLVALCVAEEPRLVLADCLAASEGEGGGQLQHGEAYRDLLEDFLTELVARGTEFAGYDPTRYALYQLHTLAREDVRRIALELARREGLVAKGWAESPSR